MADSKTIKSSGHALTLTHTDKIYWPKEKISKGALLAYYDAIAPFILPYLKNRPLSLNRHPNGIDKPGFYQKDAGENFPDWIQTVPYKAESTGKIVDYTICNNKATLLYLANLGCIEMNPWNSTIKTPDHPSYLVLDLDPSPKNTFGQVLESAIVTCDLLEKAGATYYCKTSGATGMHVYIPLHAKYPYEQVRQFGEIIASRVHEQLPSLTTMERAIKSRGNKVYLDYLQNSRGQTIASAYSVRPVNGAQVSAPVTYKEMQKGIEPAQFTIFNMQKRLAKLGDVFYMVLGRGINLKQCLRKLEG